MDTRLTPSGNASPVSLQEITGWDIGGANIKAARRDTAGWIVIQQPFPVWQQRNALAPTIADVSTRLGPTPVTAITITAELSDAFRTKQEGITVVIDAVQTALPSTTLKIFGVDGQFYNPAAARKHYMQVAAANWMATALVVADHIPDCLLVDVGSTTTDITAISGGQIMAQGRNDPNRLTRGELLYTGVLRTPVCAIVSHVPLWGHWCPVSSEHFATIQDVYLLLDYLLPKQAHSPSADGRPATSGFAAERLARIVCADIELLSYNEILTIARYIAAEHLRQIASAIARVMSGNIGHGPLVAVGAGTFLVQMAAAQLGVDCVQPTGLWGRHGSSVAPAAAVAILLNKQSLKL